MATAQVLGIQHPTTPQNKINANCKGRPILKLLDDYKILDITTIRKCHAAILRLRLTSATRKLLTAYSLCTNSTPDYALKLVDQIPEPNLHSYSALIRSFASTQPYACLLLFIRLLTDTADFPDKFTFLFTLKSASALLYFNFGSCLHAMIVESNLTNDVYITNSLIHFYGVCKKVDLSVRVFDNMKCRDIVSWNSIINALERVRKFDDALKLFGQMDEEVQPNNVSMLGLISACATKGDLGVGRSIHGYCIKSGVNCLIVDNAILDMYIKCDGFTDAESSFQKMMAMDYVSWTTMVFGYVKFGDLDGARKVFDAMPRRDVGCWNALMSGYKRQGRAKEVLAVFKEMEMVEDIHPDEVTFVIILSACAQLGMIDIGCRVHELIRKNCVRLNFHLATSLIDMYSKCGELEEAVKVFASIERKDVFVYSAMIGAHAMYGQGRNALDLFEDMRSARISPNGVTLMNVLSACSHSGIVEEGRMYFDKMESYGVSREIPHYGCMIDILGRAGLLEDAVNLISSMPIPPPASIWGALIGACVVHNNANLGKYAFEQLIKLEPTNSAAYVMLSNIYAKSNNFKEVAKIRNTMKDIGLSKERGWSSIEVHGVMHEFVVGDASHPQSESIYKKLDEVIEKLKLFGYEPGKSHVLQDVEVKAIKERALYSHSEKLAISFGLISLEKNAQVKISKNLRVCEDCHEVIRLVSKVYGKKILLRDRYRFHLFEDGMCSCSGYW